MSKWRRVKERDKGEADQQKGMMAEKERERQRERKEEREQKVLP